MPGGARPGAGRKPGAAWASKRDRDLRPAARQVIRKLLQTERDPLSVLVALACDDTLDVPLRIQAAGQALPFVYPRLSASVTVSTSPDAGSVEKTSIMAKLQSTLERLAAAHTQVVPVIDGVSLVADAT